MAEDHTKRALEILEDVRAEQGTERGLRIAEAQVHATLALVEVLAERLAHPPGAGRVVKVSRDEFGQPYPDERTATDIGRETIADDARGRP